MTGKNEADGEDEWTGSAKRPWLNPPMRYKLGTGRGAWRYAMVAIIVAIAGVIAVLVLVNTGHLARGWVYVVIPVAIIAAALARVLTIFKAGAEDERD